MIHDDEAGSPPTLLLGCLVLAPNDILPLCYANILCYGNLSCQWRKAG